MKRALLLASGLLAAILQTAPVQAKVVAYNLYVDIDTVSPSQPRIKVGDIHGGRVIFDDSEVDPATGRVKLIGFQHFVGGKYTPDRLDPQGRNPGAWLDVKSTPWRLSMDAMETSAQTSDPVNGFSPRTVRMEIRDKDGSIIVAGPYHFKPAFLSDAEIASVLKAAPTK